MSGNFWLVWISPLASRLPSQQSSMLTYWKPWAARPLATMASAAARTLASLTALAQQFQEFQPIGGVRASLCWPPTIVNSRLALPRAFLTSISTTVEPGCLSEPVMMPVSGSSARPCGQILGGKVERLFARGRNEKQKRPARRAADNPRAVNGRLGRLFMDDGKCGLIGFGRRGRRGGSKRTTGSRRRENRQGGSTWQAPNKGFVERILIRWNGINSVLRLSAGRYRPDRGHYSMRPERMRRELPAIDPSARPACSAGLSS